MDFFLIKAGFLCQHGDINAFFRLLDDIENSSSICETCGVIFGKRFFIRLFSACFDFLTYSISLINKAQRGSLLN